MAPMHGVGTAGPANARSTEASGPSLHLGTEHRIVRSRWCAIGSVAARRAALTPSGAGGGDAPHLLNRGNPATQSHESNAELSQDCQAADKSKTAKRRRRKVRHLKPQQVEWSGLTDCRKAKPGKPGDAKSWV
jgi:hypothetical protein